MLIRNTFGYIILQEVSNYCPLHLLTESMVPEDAWLEETRKLVRPIVSSHYSVRLRESQESHSRCYLVNHKTPFQACVCKIIASKFYGTEISRKIEEQIRCETKLTWDHVRGLWTVVERR